MFGRVEEVDHRDWEEFGGQRGVKEVGKWNRRCFEFPLVAGLKSPRVDQEVE